MKLYIKQRVFTWADKFNVRDEFGNDRYWVQGEVLSWGKKLHVYDMHGAEVIYIQQKIMTWMPRYHIFIGGAHAADVVRKFTFMKPEYHVEGLGMEVHGDYFAHEYDIWRGGGVVAGIGKEWFTWGDSYVMNIAYPQDELIVLAILLAIDCANAQSD